MSRCLSDAVWALLDSPPAEQFSLRQRFLLLAIANHANERRGRVAWPSIRRLARLAGCCERQIQRELRRLETTGFLLTADDERGRRLYRLSPGGDTALSPGGDTTGDTGDTARSPEPGIHPGRDPRSEAGSARGARTRPDGFIARNTQGIGRPIPAASSEAAVQRRRELLRSQARALESAGGRR